MLELCEDICEVDSGVEISGAINNIDADQFPFVKPIMYAAAVVSGIEGCRALSIDLHGPFKEGSASPLVAQMALHRSRTVPRSKISVSGEAGEGEV